MTRTYRHIRFWCLLVLGGFCSVAGAQAALEPPDCSKLSPRECTKQSQEWAARLAKARDVGEGWSVGCTRDRVTREWTCFTTKRFGGSGQNQLRVQHHPATGYCFSGPLNDHPGLSAVVRIGQNQPLRYESTLVCGDTAKLIIDQLMTEVEGATRGNVWPNKTAEFDFDSKGFPAAFESLKERVANPRP